MNVISSPASGPVLLYDGDCGLCNRVVRLLLWLDRAERLRFARLQGEAGQAYLRAHGLPAADFDSLVFVPDWPRREQREFLLRTDGVIAALRVCGGVATELAAVLEVVLARCRLPPRGALALPDLRPMAAPSAGPAGMGGAIPPLSKLGGVGTRRREGAKAGVKRVGRPVPSRHGLDAALNRK